MIASPFESVFTMYSFPSEILVILNSAFSNLVCSFSESTLILFILLANSPPAVPPAVESLKVYTNSLFSPSNFRLSLFLRAVPGVYVVTYTRRYCFLPTFPKFIVNDLLSALKLSLPFKSTVLISLTTSPYSLYSTSFKTKESFTNVSFPVISSEITQFCISDFL